MRLLLAEDDALLGESLCSQLQRAGYAVDWTDRADQALTLGRQEDYRLAILDLGLKEGSGLDTLKAWRAEQIKLPVLILTARGDWQDKVNGLKSGADDYLAKPFQMEELLARLEALSRRSEGRLLSKLVVEGYELDEERQQIITPQQDTHHLTGTEFKLLRCLMSRPQRIFPKEALMEQLYSLDDNPSENIIEAYILRLRKMLGKEVILTLRGQGYRFNASN
ncbi:response regulator transcription factor [Marinospirillum perlucidum]|uniref:response regulator transcription factor n=1 Tax=Marinospirillum perlucidum TaxID=1982602 RepID=UPI000DF2B8AF|nr:response regulator transcription factor [Marinospirillum perlucidum]